MGKYYEDEHYLCWLCHWGIGNNPDCIFCRSVVKRKRAGTVTVPVASGRSPKGCGRSNRSVSA